MNEATVEIPRDARYDRRVSRVYKIARARGWSVVATRWAYGQDGRTWVVVGLDATNDALRRYVLN